MSKSVYSLVLMDEVVEAIDQLAYQYNTSRSNLINQILAEHVSLSTPEKRMKDIFTSMERFMDETFQVQFMPSDAMLNIRSPLRYKYKPTIRYSVELYRSPGETAGRLKVQFRTQNAQLIATLEDFFRFWIQLEGRQLAWLTSRAIHYELDGGRFTRELLSPAESENLSNKDFGNRIAAYIQMLDGMIKTYFAGIDTPEEALAEIQKKYLEYVKNQEFII